MAATWDDLKRVLWHRDYGVACSFASRQGSGCKSITELFGRGWQADLWMLAGTVAVGTAAGVTGGLWCAANARTLRARVLEGVAMAGLCAPPFVFGYGLLLLFDPTFGHFQAPLFFEVHVYQPPYVDPWAFFRAMLVPWIVAGAPVFAIVLRITPQHRRRGVRAGVHGHGDRQGLVGEARRSTGTGGRSRIRWCSRGSAPRRR